MGDYESRVTELWNIFEDIVGPYSKWPRNIQRLICSTHLRNCGRFQLLLFAHVNGLDPLLMIAWFRIRHMLKDTAAWLHCIYTVNMLDKGGYQQYHAYNVCWEREEYANG